jgi:hypothetical protein
MCVDQMIYSALPFVFHWLPVFLIWSVLVGIPLAVISRIKRQPLLLYPHRYFLLGCGLMVALAPVSGGSVAAPLFLTICVALARARRSLISASKLETAPMGLTLLGCRVQRLFLAVCLGVIPVSYLPLWWQSRV